ncbi:MAG: DUF4340 domain-containing protein [Flavobacteriales bacterium]|nr:DUF4340 domain-containing protein [Flavobacteriales bacterium]
MSRSSGTRTLLIIVAALAALYFVSTRWGANSKQRSFRDQVITLDTAALTSFSLHPAKLAHAELRFERTADGWAVTHDGAVHLADTADVHALLGGLARARAHRFTGYLDRLATRYDLTDSLADRAVFRLRDGSERQVLFGRGQPAEDGSGMLSTINVVGENEVFSVKGTMSEMADQDLVAWRPTRLMAGRPADIQRVSFQYSMDTAYVLERAGNTWLVDRDTADQSKGGQVPGRYHQREGTDLRGHNEHRRPRAGLQHARGVRRWSPSCRGTRDHGLDRIGGDHHLGPGKPDALRSCA